MNHIELRTDFSLYFETRGEYLYVRIEGSGVDYDVHRECWEKIAEEFRRSQQFRLLIEQNSVEQPSMSDTFQLSSDIAEMGFDDCKFAYVDEKEENRDINEFGEVVALNRGLNCKTFSNMDEAETWLLSS